jgi:hemerythrin
MLEWKEKYVIGIEEIDAQHKALVDLIVKLFAAMQSGAGKDVLDVTITGLVDYTHRHFMTEEILMGNYDYPELDAHQEEHRKFSREVARFQEEFQAGNTGISIQLITFLRNWLDEHICETDHKYAEFFRQKGLR